MYDVTGIEVVSSDGPGPGVRAGQPFTIWATVECTTGNCPKTDVTVAIGGEVVASARLDLDRGELVNVGPPGADAGVGITRADWIEVRDGSVYVYNSGGHDVTVAVAGHTYRDEIVIGPPNWPVEDGPTPDEDVLDEVSPNG